MISSRTISRELPALLAFPEVDTDIRPEISSWSAKEELGHLIDSAANNHIRFVRTALDGLYYGSVYAQDDWVTIHGYQEMSWDALVTMWHQYNLLLSRLVANIPENKLSALCFIGSPENPVTLEFLIGDYILHMQHHLDHLLRRQVITAYPGIVEKTTPAPSEI